MDGSIKISGSISVAGRQILYIGMCIVNILGCEVAIASRIKKELELGMQSTIKGTYNVTFEETMMRTIVFVVLKSFSCFIEGFDRSLLESLQLVP